MIRAATVADARAIGALQLRAWIRAYEDIVDGSMLAGYDVEGREAQWVEILGSTDSTTFVAVVDERVCGFISLGADREEGAAADRGEVWALYVDPPAQGAGLGCSLLSAGEAWLREQGFTQGVLGVLRDNGHGRRFYESNGWVFVDGSEAERQWGPHVTYEKPL